MAAYLGWNQSAPVKSYALDIAPNHGEALFPTAPAFDPHVFPDQTNESVEADTGVERRPVCQPILTL